MLHEYSNLYFPICSLVIASLILMMYFSKKNTANYETKIFSKIVIITFVEALFTFLLTLCVHLFFNDNTEIYFAIANKILYSIYITWISIIFMYFVNISYQNQGDIKLWNLLKNSDLEIIRFQNIVEPTTLNQARIEAAKDPFRFSCQPTTDVISGEEALIKWCLGVNKINTMPWTYCVKKELYYGVQFPNVPYLEDFAIIHYLLAKSKKVMAIDFVGYHYLQYDSSLTKIYDAEEKKLYNLEKLRVFNEIIQLTKYYINKTSISTENKEIFFDDIDQRYLIRKNSLIDDVSDIETSKKR